MASASAAKTVKKDTYSWHHCNYSQYSGPTHALNKNTNFILLQLKTYNPQNSTI